MKNNNNNLFLKKKGTMGYPGCLNQCPESYIRHVITAALLTARRIHLTTRSETGRSAGNGVSKIMAKTVPRPLITRLHSCLAN